MKPGFKKAIRWFAWLGIAWTGFVIVWLLAVFALITGIRWNTRVAISGIMPALLLIGFAKITKYRFPFFSDKSNRFRWVVCFVLALIGSSLFYGATLTVVTQLLNLNYRAEFISPTNPADKIIFYDGGFTDRDLFLYAQKSGERLKYLGRLEKTGSYRFEELAWTRDGHAAVCSLTLLGGVTNDVKIQKNNKRPSLAKVIAYDFEADQIITPPWLTNHTDFVGKESEWRQFEPTVKQLAKLHGGLTHYTVDTSTFYKYATKLWFWQHVPPH